MIQHPPPASQKPSKRHHSPSRFHLERFADQSGWVWTYDMLRDTCRQSRAVETGYEKHLHTLTLPDGSQTDEVERWMAEIEGRAARVYDKLLREHDLGGQERADFASFLALCLVRSPRQRRTYAALYGKMLQVLGYTMALAPGAFDRFMEEYEREHGPVTDEVKTAAKAGLLNPHTSYQIEVYRETTLKVIAAHDKIAPIFEDMKWTVLEAADRRQLVTCDTPIALELPGPHRGPVAGVGLLRKDIQVTMPLTPRHCLFTHWQADCSKTGRLPREAIKGENRTRAYWAKRFLYGATNDGGIQQLARKFKDKEPVFRLSGPIQTGDVEVLR